MDFAGSSLEYVILPRLEDAGYLGLHALTSVEKSAHGIDQVIELFKFLHELLLG